jgi:hypothetical protein
MVAENLSSGWLLSLAQLPSAPSSARVALWRRLRAIGAAGMLNGAWALPHTPAHARVFTQLQQTVRAQCGKVFVLTVPESSPDTDAMIVERYRADRGREYDELTERYDAFLTEISKETRAGKFTFAELEENEQELKSWLAKILARDFSPMNGSPRHGKWRSAVSLPWKAFPGRCTRPRESSYRLVRRETIAAGPDAMLARKAESGLKGLGI